MIIVCPACGAAEPSTEDKLEANPNCGRVNMRLFLWLP